MRSAFPIRNDEDLDRAFELIDELWAAAPGSPDADLLEVMTTLVDRYEAAKSELPAADPVELIQFKLKELGWSQRELGRRLGWSSGRVSEVLSRTRPLTLAMVRGLSKVLELPPGLLVHDHRGADEGSCWIALPQPLASTIGATAQRRGVSIQFAVIEALTWAFRGTASVSVTDAGSIPPANNDLRNAASEAAPVARSNEFVASKRAA